jgi:hypothetical protein
VTTSPIRTALVGAIALALVTACSGTDDVATNSTTSAPTSAGAATSGAPTTVETMPASAAPARAPSTAPPTAPPTTSPAPAASIRRALLEDDSRPGAFEPVSALAVVPGAPEAVLLVGSRTDRLGGPQRAVVHTSTDAVAVTTMPLDDGGAVESWASSIAVADQFVVVAGETVAGDGRPSAVIWRSVDGGVSFGPAEAVTTSPSSAQSVAIVGGRPFVVAAVPSGTGTDLVVVDELAAGGWSGPRPLSAPELEPSVSGIAVVNGAVVITGSVTAANSRFGRVWTSSDSGATFVANDALTGYAAVGAPSLGGDGIVATASGGNGTPTELVTSPDGATWRSIQLDLTAADGDARPPIDGGTYAIQPFGDGYLVGIDGLEASVAVVDAGGRGIVDDAPSQSDERFFAPIPFVANGTAGVVGRSARSFQFAAFRGSAQEGDAWVTAAGDAARAVGPVADGVSLTTVTDGPLASAFSWPLVGTGPNGTRWESAERWLVRTDAGWERSSSRQVPVGSSTVATNGALEVALGNSGTDPLDSGRGGPIGATWAYVRSVGGSWGVRTLILSGPGGDNVADVAPTTNGFIAVGTRSERLESGDTASSIAIVEYDGTAWAPQPVAIDITTDAGLWAVAAAPDGMAVAVGWRSSGATTTPVVVTRPVGGNWAEVALPTEAADIDVFDVEPTEAGVVLLAREDNATVVYTTLDGVQFVRTPVVVDAPETAFPVEIAALGDRTILVGTRLAISVSRLAIWSVAADGAAAEIELDAREASRGLWVNGVISYGSTIYAGGAVNGANVVWEIDLP